MAEQVLGPTRKLLLLTCRRSIQGAGNELFAWQAETLQGMLSVFLLWTNIPADAADGPLHKIPNNPECEVIHNI